MIAKTKDVRVEVTATRRGWMPFITVDGRKRYCQHLSHRDPDAAWRCAEAMAAREREAS